MSSSIKATAATNVRGRRVLFIRVRLRVCDDSKGPLVAQITQRRGRAGRVFARSRFTRRLPPTDGTCRRYRIDWRVRGKLLGTGIYAVELRVRDAEGASSEPVGTASGRR